MKNALHAQVHTYTQGVYPYAHMQCHANHTGTCTIWYTIALPVWYVNHTMMALQALTMIMMYRELVLLTKPKFEQNQILKFDHTELHNNKEPADSEAFSLHMIYDNIPDRCMAFHNVHVMHRHCQIECTNNMHNCCNTCTVCPVPSIHSSSSMCFTTRSIQNVRVTVSM